MRQGTGYTYSDSAGEEWIISYKCEGCGRRVRVTPAQVQHFRGAVTACSRVCVMKAHERRTEQRRLAMGMLEPADSATLGPEAGATPAPEGTRAPAEGITPPHQPTQGRIGTAGAPPVSVSACAEA